MLIRKAARLVCDFTCDSRRWAAYKRREEPERTEKAFELGKPSSDQSGRDRLVRK